MTHYHIIGIGGAGMSAIAHLLLDQGHRVSGCDQQANHLTRELAARGATICIGHDAAHLRDVEVVAISSALRSDHPELLAARQRDLPVVKRADLWHTWSQHKATLAIAGTHGKTTTTAMCALILSRLGSDPAYIVPAGGPVPGLERYARWGSGPFVIEADEYDRLFLGLVPEVAIVTSVDWDHVDVYPTPAAVAAAFDQFARQTRRALIVCQDDPGAQQAAQRWQAELAEQRIVVYGTQGTQGWQASAIRQEQGWTCFEVVDHESGMHATGRLRVPGLHNVRNALGAALGVRELLGVQELAPLLAALEEFRGAARRFEYKGEAAGVTVIDDYAHNPPKVQAALQAARMRYPQRRLVAYFQPHTFSRTQALIDAFATAFDAADVVVIGAIYPSRERADDFPGIDAAWLAQRLHHPQVIEAGDSDAAVACLEELLRPGDVLLTLGAGDGYLVGERVLARLARRSSHAAPRQGDLSR